MAVFLGLAVAAGYGVADFLGGHMSRRSTTGAVLVGSQATGLVLSVVIVTAEGAPMPAGGQIAYAVGAGLVGVTALAFFFRGLAVARMGVVAPVAAAIGALIPVGWGLGSGERPSAVALTGVALAVIAVLLISRGPPEVAFAPARLTPLGYATAAGIGFGFVFVLFAEASTGSGTWPLLHARLASVPAVLVVLIAARRPLTPGSRPDTAGIMASGVFDTVANLLLLVAVRRELLSLVSPVASLYPAGPVILARLVLGERLHRQQLWGVALALAGLALIGAG